MSYKLYTQLLKLNNGNHNNTDCITLLFVVNTYQSVEVSVGGSIAKPVYNTIKGVKGVVDIIETKEAQKLKRKCWSLFKK